MAKNRPSIVDGSIPARQSEPAATAMVRLSSSALATDRSPGTAGTPQAFAISCLESLNRGM